MEMKDLRSEFLWSRIRKAN